jgi:hypothetical protein
LETERLKMAEYPYQRAYERYHYEAPIKYSYYDTEESYDGKMYNYSIGGMYFESNSYLKPGSSIQIKMLNYSPGRSGPERYQTYRAEVRWCREMARSDASYYGIGAKYYEPVSY